MFSLLLGMYATFLTYITNVDFLVIKACLFSLTLIFIHISWMFHYCFGEFDSLYKWECPQKFSNIK